MGYIKSSISITVGRGGWGGFESAHVIFEQPPPQTKINTKEDRNCQIESPFVDSLIQNGYDITWPYLLFPIGSLKNIFNCDKCQYKDVSNTLLRVHNKYFHKDGKFTCDICGHQGSRKQSFKKYKLI